MIVLGIESSSTTASVALIEDDQLLAEYTMNNTMKHSKTLMPMMEDMLKRLEMNVNVIDLVAVSEGPGSFTGLRIGSATAKGLAQGLNIKIANIPTLEVLASQIQVPGARVGVVVFARAREVYYATYTIDFNNGHFTCTLLDDLCTLEIEDLMERLRDKDDKNFFLVGDAITKFAGEFESLRDKVSIPAPIYCSFSAKNVAFLGLKRYYNNDVMTCYEQKPYYHKQSQAEREYEEKHS
jgi:tRNA threonylcarbamoyl adenosine modification protein YeaZ